MSRGDLYVQEATGHTFLVGRRPHALPVAECLQ